MTCFCISDIKTIHYFITGVADTTLNSYLRMYLSVKMNFPAIAKIGAGVLAFLIIVFGAVIFRLIRMLRKRHATTDVVRLKF